MEGLDKPSPLPGDNYSAPGFSSLRRGLVITVCVWEGDKQAKIPEIPTVSISGKQLRGTLQLQSKRPKWGAVFKHFSALPCPVNIRAVPGV